MGTVSWGGLVAFGCAMVRISLSVPLLVRKTARAMLPATAAAQRMIVMIFLLRWIWLKFVRRVAMVAPRTHSVSQRTPPRIAPSWGEKSRQVSASAARITPVSKRGSFASRKRMNWIRKAIRGTASAATRSVKVRSTGRPKPDLSVSPAVMAMKRATAMAPMVEPLRVSRVGRILRQDWVVQLRMERQRSGMRIC